VRAARELVAEGGFGAASVAAVAGRAGVATGTVYKHFPGKADLLVEVFRERSGREVEAVRAAAADGGVGAAAEAFSRRALAARRLAWALIAEPVDPAVEAERLVFRRAYAAVFADHLQAAGHPAPQLTAAALVGGLAEALVGPLSADQDPDHEALVAGLVAFATHAARSPEHVPA
jgi:AcrR family transcriptional regulator